ncbi:MAG: TRAP transporter fused permease subunit [Gammaproteobacteria bacterium]|nr:TRAP transporter fused permease subunit [Gammaproteobacteria bacterium]
MTESGAPDSSDSAVVRALRVAMALVAIAMSLFHLLTAYPGIGAPRNEVFLPAHLAFVLVILYGDAFVVTLSRRRIAAALLNAVLIIASIAPAVYLMTHAEDIANRFAYAEPLEPIQVAYAIALVVAILEAARRTVGLVLVAVMMAFLIYGWLGQSMPGVLYHQGFTVNQIAEMIYATGDGLWSAPIRVCASFIFLFVLFGSFLLASGAGTFFTDLAWSLTGRSTGGPAKSAVVASAFMGMLSGSSAANVVTTGSFTIPAMKRVGYQPAFAAGVEAVASTGGQLTPPIMGAAAFLMIEFVGVSYIEIMQFAIIPAILYFFAVFMMVHLEARRLGLRPDLSAELPRLGDVLRRRGYLMLPIVVLMYYLFEGYTPSAAGFFSIVSLVALVLLFDADKRRMMHRVLWQAMTEAPRMMVAVTVACAIGGMIAGVILLTGLGVRMSSIILDISGGVMIAALLLTMLTAVVLGMGMPTSGAYIILAALLGSGLTNLGVPEIGAHMFIIFCAAMSGITPPVAISSFAAAAIAGSDPWRTSLVAIKLGLSVYLIPYMFVYGPALLGFGTVLEVSTTVLTALIGITALSVACIGWLRLELRLHERALAFLAAVLMMYAGLVTDLLGLLVIGLLGGSILLRQRQIGRAAHAR